MIGGKFKKVDLETIAGGAALELFEHKLEEVLENIADLNTPAVAARKVVLTVTLKPDAERESAAITIGCDAKLAPITPASSKMHMGRDGNKLCGYEREDEEVPNNVAAIGE